MVLKAYLDDSGSPANPDHSYLTVAGYLADDGHWALFEERWGQALEAAGVPYLHMREFGNRDSKIYRHLKADPIKELDFITSLVDAIDDSLWFCPGATVKLPDLHAFNAKHGLDIDPYAIAIYGCLIETRRDYRKDPVDLIFDAFEKSGTRVDLALDYARMDVAEDLKADLFTPTHLQDEESFKTVLPLQAADFVAWECRKSCEDRKDWKFTREDRSDPHRLRRSYLEWSIKTILETGKPPRARGSLKALHKHGSLRPRGFVWDEANLEAALGHHPNGWTAPPRKRRRQRDGED